MTVSLRGVKPEPARNEYRGAFTLPRNTFSALAIPSKHNISYLLAGISILYMTSVAVASKFGFPFEALPISLRTISRSDVTSSSSMPYSKHSASKASWAAVGTNGGARVCELQAPVNCEGATTDCHVLNSSPSASKSLSRFRLTIGMAN